MKEVIDTVSVALASGEVEEMCIRDSFRTVALYSVPKVHFRDLVAIPDLDATYTDGSLTINADIRNLEMCIRDRGYRIEK